VTEKRRSPRYRVLRTADGCAVLLMDAQNKPIDTKMEDEMFQARGRQVIDKKSTKVSLEQDGNDLM
jgi:hypothetical protein